VERWSSAKTLRSEFQQEAFTGDGLNDTAGTKGGFEDFSLNARIAEGVGADEARNSAADHQCWDVTGHGVLSILARSESFGKERLVADQLLFF
jgi:hypothetical protein